jgi:hypothetical protein
VDYWGVVREAWRVSRRTPALWWLGVITAAQLIVYTGIVMMLLLPMVMIPRLIVPLSLSAEGLPADSNPLTGGITPQLAASVTDWLSANLAPLVAGMVAVILLWIVLGVFDVAAQPGLITQASAASQGEPASVSAGMRDGFRLWWRTIGLLALAALPSLLYLLVMALVTLFTVSLPLYRGELPSPGASIAANMLASPLSTLTSLAAIPLGVLVQLSLRFGVVENREWRSALGQGWRLIKTRFADVAFMYLSLLGVSLIVSIPLTVVIVIITGVAAVVAISSFAAGAGGMAMGVTAIVIGVTAMMLLMFAVSVAWFVYQSVVWTLFWRRATGRDPLRSAPPATEPTRLSEVPPPQDLDSKDVTA